MRGGRAELRLILVALAALAAVGSAPLAAAAGDRTAGGRAMASAFPSVGSLRTTTPIKHLVVIIPENQSFDHYFGTYPKAENLPGEVRFKGQAEHAQGRRTEPRAARTQPES